MATAPQTIANQANAQHSTGPRTPDGKAASSRNATTHGLSSPLLVLAHESQDEFNELVGRLTGEHKPANPHQAFLVDQLIISRWQLARAQRLQIRAFDHLASSIPNPEDADGRIVARMFESNPNTLATLQRYAAQAERSYYKAYNELKAAKQIQHQNELVGGLDARTIRNAIQAPMPDHPLYGSQYGNPKPQNPLVPNKPNSSPTNAAQPPAKPSLRSQMPENLALCL